jgi:hypothetical protein
MPIPFPTQQAADAYRRGVVVRELRSDGELRFVLTVHGYELRTGQHPRHIALLELQVQLGNYGAQLEERDGQLVAVLPGGKQAA